MIKFSIFNARLILLLCTLVFLQACQQPANPNAINLSELTIAQIHKDYQSGRYNSQDLVNAYLHRIEQHNDKINAISMVNKNALSVAAALDKEFAKTGELRPLHGIPILVKDNINTANMPTTAGSLALATYVPSDNAFIVKKLVDAGAIVLAKTNMAEWAFSPMHTNSSTIGTTYNAYNQDYVPAGSSGGTAAAIAANFATIGLGTDTGNSIRGPSSHNALVGFRTSIGLVSRSAIVPLFLRNDVVGPMTRTVEDATRVLDLISGYDSADPITAYSNSKIPNTYTQFLNSDGLKGARIGVLTQLSANKPDPEIADLFTQALNDLTQLGAEVVSPVNIPNFDQLRENQWCAKFEEDLADFLSTYVKNDKLTSLEDIIKVGSSTVFAQSRLEGNLGKTGRFGENKTPCSNAFNDPLRIAFRESIEKVMDDLKLDALVYPSWNNKAARITRFKEEYKGDNSQVISPHTGQPAFTIPMGFTSENLPAGLQFLGRMFDEATLIKLTYAYEQGTQHRKPAVLD